jgi:glycerophosphoryl diester phosphodiesterase
LNKHRSHQPTPRFAALLQATLALAGHLRQAILLFFLIAALLQALIAGPAVALLLNGLIGFSGERAIGNFDIAVFLLSPIGLGFVLVLVFTTLLMVLVTLAALMLMAESVMDERSEVLAAVWAGLRRRWRALLALTGVGMMTIALVALPTALLLWLVHGGLLTEHDINYYLAFRPAEFKLALLLAALVLVPAAIALVTGLAALVFALPFLLFEGQGARAALRSAKAMLAGRYRLVLRLIAGLLLAVLVLSLLLHGGLFLATKLLIGLFGSSLSLLLPVLGLSLALTLLVSIVITYLAECSAAFAVLLVWRSLTGREVRVPSRSRPLYLPRRALVVAGIAAALVATLVSAHLLIADIDLEDRVLNVAHRGSSLKAPENLLSAVKQAAADGADAAEIDVQRSADGVIVVIHDRDLMRVGGQPLVVNQTPYAELADVDVGGRVSAAFAGESIPSLDQVVEFAQTAGLGLFIELKSYDDDGERLARDVVALLQRHDWQGHAIIMSLNYAEIHYLKEYYPQVQAGFLASAALGRLTRLDADFLAVSAGMLSDALITSLHAGGKKVCVWTIDDPEAQSALIDRGVDCIITNRPELLVEVLAQRRGLSTLERLLLRYRQVYAGD